MLVDSTTEGIHGVQSLCVVVQWTNSLEINTVPVKCLYRVYQKEENSLKNDSKLKNYEVFGSKFYFDWIN